MIKKAGLIFGVLIFGFILGLFIIGSNTIKQGKDIISDKELYDEKYQQINTEYITFKLPNYATHYWGNNETNDTYELIIHNFSIY